MLKKCEQPLIFAAPNFVEKSVCVNLIRAAKMYGKAVPQFGHDVKYEMPLWPELHAEMDSDTARELESIYRLWCWAGKRAEFMSGIHGDLCIALKASSKDRCVPQMLAL